MQNYFIFACINKICVSSLKMAITSKHVTVY